MEKNKPIAMITILDEKIVEERNVCRERNKQAETAETGVKEYHLRVSDYHMGVAHGLEIAREVIIKNMHY